MRGLRLPFLLLAVIALFPALVKAAEPAVSAPGTGTCLRETARLDLFGLEPLSTEPLPEAAGSPFVAAPEAAGRVYGCHFYGGYCWADCRPCQCDSECPGGGCWEVPLC